MGTSALLVDGHWDASGDWGGLIYVPSVEEVQEFKVQTNAFSPQYGWSTGNAVNVVTKSATSSFHGGMFEFLRNNHLDANNFFANKNALPRPQFKRNQFGFDLGGPLYLPGLYRQKDRTFVFGSFEGLRQQTPTTAVYTVPTAEQRQGDFTRTLNADGSLAAIFNPFTTRRQGAGFVRDPFPGNRIPQQMMDPVALKLAAYWPQPNRGGQSLTGQDNLVGVAGLPIDSDAYSIRIDHNLTGNQRLFGRWSQKRQVVQGFGEFFGKDNPGGMGVSEPNPRWDLALGYTNAVNPSLVISATLGFGRWIEESRPQGVPFLPSSVGLPAALDGFGGPGAFPGIGVTGLTGLGSGALARAPREARTYALDLTKVRGRHTLSAGFMAIDFRLNRRQTSQATFSFARSFTQGPDPNAPSVQSGAGLAALLLGTGSSGGITLSAEPAFQKSFMGWYLNDEIRLRRGLTVNVGVRYDFQTAPTDRFDRLTYWSQERNSIGDTVGLPLTGGLRYTGDGNPRGVYDAQHTNIAPRVGLSYAPIQRLVFRAGFGIFYIPAIDFGNLSLTGFSQRTTYVGSLDGITPQDLLRNPFPDGFLLPPAKSAGDRTNLGQPVSMIERGHPTPYVEQWTAGWQFQLDSATVIEAAYFGNHGVKLTYSSGDWSFQRNQLRPELLSLGSALLDPVANPFFGVIATGVLAGRTVPRGRLLRPYPQFDSVLSVSPPLGMSNYHALTLSANRRFSRGLQVMVSFTGSKYLTDTEGPEGWTQGPAQRTRNFYDLSGERAPMINDVPRSLVVSYIYELPVGKGRKWGHDSRLTEGIFGGWQIAGITTLKSGFPLPVRAVTNNTNSLGGNQRPNLVGNPALENPTAERWFDITAFRLPAPYTFGNAPRTMGYLRAMGTNNFDFTIQKYWRFAKEQTRLQFRAEFFNLFNRTGLYAPNPQFGDPGFGAITQAMPARSIQLGMKLYW